MNIYKFKFIYIYISHRNIYIYIVFISKFAWMCVPACVCM